MGIGIVAPCSFLSKIRKAIPKIITVELVKKMVNYGIKNRMLGKSSLMVIGDSSKIEDGVLEFCRNNNIEIMRNAEYKRRLNVRQYYDCVAVEEP